MKARHFFLLYFSLYVLSCSPDPNSNNTHRISLTDTLFIPTTSSELAYGGRLKQEDVFLFADLDNGVTILEVNRNGALVAEWEVGGSGPEKIGSTLSAFNYVNNTAICLVSERGIYILDRSKGSLLKEKEYLDGSPWFIEKRLVRFNSENKDLLVFVHASNPEQISIKNPDYFQKTLNFTVYDRIRDSIFLKIGFEKNSRLRSKNVQPPNIFRLMARRNDKLLCLYSHQPQIFTYNVFNNFKFIESLPLHPDNFTISDPDNELIKRLANSSEYTGLAIDNDLILATYRTGIPGEQLKGDLQDPRNLQELYAKHNKVYAQVVLDGRKMGTDILCPPIVHSVEEALGNNLFLFKPNNSKVEFPNREAYFIGKLEPL